MSVQVEKLEKNTVKLTIEVPAEELEKALQEAYNRQKKNISMPGFRKGKVPRAMVEKMYGAGVFYEDAANALIPQAYADAAKECGEDIVSIPGFEDQLIGKNAGDDVDVNVTFPDEYHAEDLAGKEATFKVKIHEIKAKEIPELDDEFVQDVSEFDTVAEYKDSVKAKLEEQKQNEIKRAYQDEAIDKIVDKSTMELPDAMIDTQCENMINQFAQQMAQQGLSMDQYLQFSGLTLDQLKEQVRPDAITRIKSSLVLEQIAKEENIEITDADVDAEIEKMATMYNMEADKLKEYMGEDEKENMKQDLAVQKAVELITESVKPRAKAKTKKEKEAEAETEAAE